MSVGDDLHDFVKEALTRKLPRPQIEDLLVRAGWSAGQVAAALGGFSDVDFPMAVPRPRSYVSARDAFLYLVLFGTLCLSAIHSGTIAFLLIERAFPDPSTPARLLAAAPANMRWSIAFLVVAFPMFLWVWQVTNRAVRADAAKQGSKVRRWLTYLTLFVAASFLLGDVVTVVFNLLGGELTVRFILKVLTVAAIAGPVFLYYRRSLAIDDSNAP